VLGLAEVRDAAVAAFGRSATYKFVFELAWRDYYVRIHALAGDAVWNDLEPYKTGENAASYAREMPADIAGAATGAACIDGFVRELVETGYLHNHARMWFASYLVHWRRVRWQAGAAFFLRFLLDGDAASNNLSWQWVASTFAHKPYVFNRENLERYTRGAYCAVCPLAQRGCPFESSYGQLSARLFPNGTRAKESATSYDLRVPADPDSDARTSVPERVVVWQHDESLSSADAARTVAPKAPAIYVWDEEARRRDPWSAERAAFVNESLAELGLARTAHGDAALEIAAFARERDAETIVAVAPVEPRLRAIARDLAERFELVLLDPPAFARLDRPVDLRRFSRYWNRAQHTAFGAAARLDLGIETT